MESFKEEKEPVKNYSDDDLRAMSEAELEEFIQSNYGSLGGLGGLFINSLPYEKKNNIERAKKILHEREIEKEKQQKKALDDGSVKGLILSGDYSEVGPSVYIQQIADNTVIWMESVYGYMGNCWYTKNTLKKNSSEWSSAEETAQDVVTVCRRKFKKEDIILISITGRDNTSGIVLTEKKIFSFSQGKPEYIITYDEIDEVDFTSNSVIIRTTEGNEAALFCGNKEYGSDPSKNMYNLIMDIKDRLEEL